MTERTKLIPVVGSIRLFKYLKYTLKESNTYKLVHISNVESIYGLSGRGLYGVVYLADWWTTYSSWEGDIIQERLSYRFRTGGNKEFIVLGPKDKFNAFRDLIYRTHRFNFINAHDAVSMHDIVAKSVDKKYEVMSYAYMREHPEYESRFTERTLDLLLV